MNFSSCYLSLWTRNVSECDKEGSFGRRLRPGPTPVVCYLKIIIVFTESLKSLLRLTSTSCCSSSRQLRDTFLRSANVVSLHRQGPQHTEPWFYLHFRMKNASGLGQCRTFTHYLTSACDCRSCPDWGLSQCFDKGANCMYTFNQMVGGAVALVWYYRVAWKLNNCLHGAV